MNALRSRFRRRPAVPRSALPSAGATLRLLDSRMAETARAPSTSSRRRAPTTGIEQLEIARQGDLLPYFRLLESEAGPVVEMEGRETIMLGSNNYLGLTGDPRVKARRARRPRALRHRRSPARASERHHPAARRARARDRRLDGHRGRARLHDRLPGEPRLRSARSSSPGDTVICDSGDHASILDGCRSRAPSCAPSATTGWTSSSGCSSARRGDGGGVLVVVDGVFSMEGDVCAPAADRRAQPSATAPG